MTREAYCNIGNTNVVLPEEAWGLSGTTIEPCPGCKFAAHLKRMRELYEDKRIADRAGLYSAALAREHHVSATTKGGQDVVALCFCDCDIDYRKK